MCPILPSVMERQYGYRIWSEEPRTRASCIAGISSLYDKLYWTPASVVQTACKDNDNAVSD